MFTRSRPKSNPTIPPGQRIYAVGDIHGEGVLLRQALRLIKADSDPRRDAEVTLVFLGDIIDRGPEAADLLRTFARMSAVNVVVLKGNHEAALVEAYRGDHDVLREWLPFGASATLAGFDITPEEIDADPAILVAVLQAHIDPTLIAWLDGLPSAWECGDYYFTHAGIRPGVKLHKQDARDLRWIREPFLSSRRWHGKVIVHGHTIEPGLPMLGGNRIGIDTGAHEHGVLTVLGLEGGRQWLLQSMADRPEDDARVDLPVAAGVVPSALPGSRQRVPMHDIDTLIAAVVTPEPDAPDAVLSLKTPVETAIGPALTNGRAKRLGNKGVAAAGFALFAAVVGGAIAIRSRPAPVGTGNISMPIPDFSPGGVNVVPVVPVVPIAKHPVGHNNRTRLGRRFGEPTVPEEAGPDATEGASPRLYGAALERALEEDRAITRRLNQDELSRQQAPSSRPK